MKRNESDCGCGCDDGHNRREFLAAAGTAYAGATFASLPASAGEAGASGDRNKEGARVRAAFLYPPSKTFADDPDGWWSWPGNHFDAEDRQKRYVRELRSIEKKLGVSIALDDAPIATDEDAARLARQIQEDPPDGLLLMMFYNRSLPHADLLLEAAEKAGVPVVFFIGLGVKHGPVVSYRRPGSYFIQSLDNFEAIQYGLRMINTKKRLGQSLILSITEADRPREGTEESFGIKVRVIPFARYARLFEDATIDQQARRLIDEVTGGAREVRGVSQKALDSAARAHRALSQLLAEEQADGLTMNCLRRGMLKPCISFATLNNRLVPAACENDLPAAYTQLIGQLLTGRPGFQHNPCYETERNHYYASHCTCATRLHGPEAAPQPYLLQRFAHSNEGSCAIQVLWRPGDPVTMARYYPGKEPSLDVYAGRVVASHPIPPGAGCTTNVEIEITDRPDACMVRGHHNLLFCGDFARKFRLFAQLYKIPLAETGYPGPWPA